MIDIRIRNIKLNVFLNEEEQILLKEKSNKARLTQSDFIRKLITEYDNNDNPYIKSEKYYSKEQKIYNKLG